MSRIGIAFGFAFLITMLFMLALRPLAVSVGLVDRPGGRKQHTGTVPVIGGLAMFAGLLFGTLYVHSSIVASPYFLGAVALLVMIGALDDRYDLPAVVRLLAQASAALLMIVGADLAVVDLGDIFPGVSSNLGPFSAIFTMLIVMTAINAYNMFDGSDGIAGVQGLVALIFFGFLAMMNGETRMLTLVACLIGCILAFLAFNWPSKRMNGMRAFMGDAGSTMLGFSFAWLCTKWSQGPDRVMSPVVALWIFALPIYDFFSSMIRRILSGRSPLHGDSEHLHHLLRRFGLHSRGIALVILVSAAIFAAIGAAGYLVGISDAVMFGSWLLLGAAYYLVFASGLIVKRRADPREDDSAATGTHPSLWRQR